MAQQPVVKGVPYQQSRVGQAKNPLSPGVWTPADAMYADTVPFYPSQKYIDKNLAPEQFPKEAIVAAARAARKAVDAGVISPSLATKILPNILTENRPDDFGVNTGRWIGGTGASIGKIVKSLGLDKDTVVKEDVQMSAADAHRFGLPAGPIYKKGDVVIQPKSGDNPAELAHNAQLMTAVLAEKASRSSSDDEVIKRWNGAGKGAENHLSKVLQVSDMLTSEPKNAAIMDLFRKEFMRDVKTPDPLEGKI